VGVPFGVAKIEEAEVCFLFSHEMMSFSDLLKTRPHFPTGRLFHAGRAGAAFG
jgi:hypothetical protein